MTIPNIATFDHIINRPSLAIYNTTSMPCIYLAMIIFRKPSFFWGNQKIKQIIDIKKFIVTNSLLGPPTDSRKFTCDSPSSGAENEHRLMHHAETSVVFLFFPDFVRFDFESGMLKGRHPVLRIKNFQVVMSW